MTYEEVLSHFEVVRRLGDDKAEARCAGHDDAKASLSISRGTDGRTVMCCHAGCKTVDVLAAKGLAERDLFSDDKPAPKAKPRIVATYSYRDATGAERYQITRWCPKDFRPRRLGSDGKWIWNLQGVERIPYRLPELFAASMDTTVFIVEGEKDADALTGLGMVATTNPGGCGSTKLWDTEPFRAPFHGRDVVILPDADAPGRKHGAHVAAALSTVARSLRVLELAGSKDVSDWLFAGHSVEELPVLVQAAPEWTPQAGPARVDVVAPDAVLPAGEYRFSESEAARRFGDQIRGRYLWVADEGQGYAYDGKRHVRDHGGLGLLEQSLRVSRAYAEDAAKCGSNDAHFQARLEMAKKYNGLAGRKRLMELVRAEPGIASLSAELDADPWLLNVENGTINLRTGELRAQSSADKITKLAPVAFDHAAQAPTWDSHLLRVVPDASTRQTLQILVGYTLTGSTREHRLPIFIGPRQTGKSVTLTTIQKMLGDYAVSAQAAVLMAKAGQMHSCEYMPMRGARMVYVPELPPGRLDETFIKPAVGADPITARWICGNPVTFLPTFKIWAAANEEPRVRDAGGAMRRRLLIVPFKEKIADHERDPKLPEKLQAEMSGILNWCLEGCRRWLANGLDHDISAQVVAATGKYFDEQDLAKQFVAACCVVDAEAKVSKSALYHRFSDWYKSQGATTVPLAASFATMMRDQGFEDENKYLRVNGRSERAWQGVRLASDYSDYSDNTISHRVGENESHRESIQNSVAAVAGVVGSEDGPGEDWS